MRTYLSVKAKSLAAEAVIIRRAERAALRRDRTARKRRPSLEFSESSLPMQEYFGLRDHRLGIVRSEARAALLALGFLKEMSYRRMEGHSTRTPVAWSRVLELAKKYGGGGDKTKEAEIAEKLKAWQVEAEKPQTAEEKAAEKAARDEAREAWAARKAARKPQVVVGDVSKAA